MKIFVIRHGETASNAARIVQTPETPLSPRGLDQAARLARRLAREGVARILSSDLRRAVMTAEAVAEAAEATLQLDPLLQERNFGHVRGTPYADLTVNLFAPGYSPPGGESWEDFDVRVDAAWDRVRASAAGTVGNLAVVTHGLVCRSLVRRHLSRSREDSGQPIPEQWPNTSLTIVEGQAPWTVRLLNCTTHLEGAPSEAGGAV